MKAIKADNTTAANDPEIPEEIIFTVERPCRSDCVPCCLQVVQVRGVNGSLIGSVHQKVDIKCLVLPTCGLFDIVDDDKNVVYQIRTPCIVTTYCCTEATFIITDAAGREVGDITKVHGNVVKEALTDDDKFYINYPEGCNVKMKAVILSALILFDYIFYEY